MQPTGKLPPFSRLQEGSWCASELDAGKTASRFRLNRGARPIGRVGGRCIKANENDVVISVTPTSRAFSAEECRESSVRRVVPVRGHVPVRARYVRSQDLLKSARERALLRGCLAPTHLSGRRVVASHGLKDLRQKVSPSSTVRDEGAPVGYDGAACFEVVRSLVGTRDG